MKAKDAAVTAVVAVLLSCAAPVSGRGRRPIPLYDHVLLAPVQIVAVRPVQTAPRADEDAALTRLRDLATQRITHDLIANGIAQDVLPAAASMPVPASDTIVVDASLSIPVSIDPRQLGMRAQRRHDYFAWADVTLRTRSGSIVVRRHDPIRWDDVTWCRHVDNRGRGEWHIANRPLDDVLADTVCGTVDRAIYRASKDLRKARSRGER